MAKVDGKENGYLNAEGTEFTEERKRKDEAAIVGMVANERIRN